MRRALCAILVCAACGGGDDPPAKVFDAPPVTPTFDAPPTVAYDAPPTVQFDGPIFTQGCMVTLAGAVDDTFPCAVTAGKNDAQAFSIFGLSSTSGNVNIVMTLQVDGTLAVGDHLADVSTGAATITVGVGESYVATKGSDNDIGSIGTLRITTLTALPPSGGVQVWSPHGSVTATLPSVTTSGTMVTLSATF